jgi:tetratricopeptide (TPR) repeat protein
VRKGVSTKNKKHKNKLAALVSASLSIIALSCPLSGLCLAEKTASPVKAEKVNAQTEFPKGQIYTKGLGLTPQDLRLVNQGQFAELANKLYGRGSSAKLSRSAAWLAFAYLYLQKCDDLNQLANSYTTSNASGTVDINLILIKTFAYLCDKKIDLADKELQKIPAAAMDDAFVNYAFATLAGKEGKAQIAIAYTKRAVELAPDFAWGYRTIAFLQEKWLHQFNEAKENYSTALAIEPKLNEASTALINLHIANNEYDQAIAIAKEAILHNPRNSVGYWQLANIYLQQWRLNEAAEQLKKAISLDANNTQYYRQLAFILQKEGKVENAVDTQKKAISRSSDKSTDLVFLAALQLENGQQDEAIASLKEAIEANPENIAAISALTRISIQLGKFDDLLTELNKCVSKFPKNEALKIHLGDAYAAAQQLDKAIDAYKEAANLSPGDAEPHTKIAALLVTKNDYDAAVKEYTRALNINPNSAANLVALGSCEAQMDDYLKAEAAFVTALALHQLTQPIDSTVVPTRVDIIRGLAALLYKEGRYADAASQFMAVVDMDKNSATASLNKFMAAQAVALRDLSKDTFKQLVDAYNNLSAEEKNSQKINYIDTLLRSKHYDEALSLLKEMDNAKDANGLKTINSPFYWICYAQAYLGKNDTYNATKAAQKAMDICEKDKSPKSDVYCQLGEVLYVKGDFLRAERNANSAIGVNSKAFRAYVLLGNIAMKQITKLPVNQPVPSEPGQPAALALEGANKALEINPYYVDAYLLLGKAQTAEGDYKGALTTYNKAVDLYPALLQTHELLLDILNKIGTKEEIAREQALIDSLKSKQ